VEFASYSSSRVWLTIRSGWQVQSALSARRNKCPSIDLRRAVHSSAAARVASPRVSNEWDAWRCIATAGESSWRLLVDVRLMWFRLHVKRAICVGRAECSTPAALHGLASSTRRSLFSGLALKRVRSRQTSTQMRHGAGVTSKCLSRVKPAPVKDNHGIDMSHPSY